MTSDLGSGNGRMELVDGSRIGVIGGGPAGTFFTHFLQRMADTVGLDVSVDIYEPRFFTHCGPAGCNHCGGIVSESLVQLLATEGINLPPSVVRRGIDAYVLHMDIGDVSIRTPGEEKRIAAVYRGNGPRCSEPLDITGFDGFMLDLTASAGARVVRKLVHDVSWHDGRPHIMTVDGAATAYDLVVVAAGINGQTLNLLRDAAPTFRAPAVQKTFICEFRLGKAAVDAWFGHAMHVFLVDLPRLTFAALIPKGEFVTLAMLGDDLDEALVDAFLATDEVRNCFPQRIVPPPACHCFPRINVAAARQPYADRMVWVGDCGVARLYKDGIGSAYRTGKAAARAAVFNGLSAADFAEHYWPACKALDADNTIAKFIFAVTHAIQKARFLRRGVMRMTAAEQRGNRARPMSGVLWDVFTGSAPYRDVLMRTVRPGFSLGLAWNLVAGNLPFARPTYERRSDP